MISKYARGGFVPACHGDRGGWGAGIGHIPGPVQEPVAGGGRGRDGDHLAVRVGVRACSRRGRAALGRAHCHAEIKGRYDFKVCGSGFVPACHGDRGGWGIGIGHIPGPVQEPVAGGGRGRDGDHLAVRVGVRACSRGGRAAFGRAHGHAEIKGRNNFKVRGGGFVSACHGDRGGWRAGIGHIPGPVQEPVAGGGRGRDGDHLAFRVGVRACSRGGRAAFGRAHVYRKIV